jgi:hypothetical protein
MSTKTADVDLEGRKPKGRKTSHPPQKKTKVNPTATATTTKPDSSSSKNSGGHPLAGLTLAICDLGKNARESVHAQQEQVKAVKEQTKAVTEQTKAIKQGFESICEALGGGGGGRGGGGKSVKEKPHKPRHNKYNDPVSYSDEFGKFMASLGLTVDKPTPKSVASALRTYIKENGGRDEGVNLMDLPKEVGDFFGGNKIVSLQLHNALMRFGHILFKTDSQEEDNDAQNDDSIQKDGGDSKEGSGKKRLRPDDDNDNEKEGSEEKRPRQDDDEKE